MHRRHSASGTRTGFRAPAFAALAALAILWLAPAPALFAQEHAGGHAAPASGGQNGGQGSFLTPQTAQSQNLAAAEQEDETAVYRHSASVRAVGRMLHLGPEEAARLFEYLNFGILAAAVLFFLWKYLPGIFRRQRETIQKNLVDARTAAEQANERLTAVEHRLARLDEEIAAIREQAERENAEDEARRKASLAGERERIVAAAGQEIRAAGAAAGRSLKRFAAELALGQAVRRISLSEENDRMLVRQFAEELGEAPGNGHREPETNGFGGRG